MSGDYNLLEEKWIPVRRRSGRRDWIAPHEIADTHDPGVELDAMRPDFNGALVQFLIALVQTAAPPADESEWRTWFRAPPAMDHLASAFADHHEAFNLYGAGSRFMQEKNLSTEGGPSIRQLLIGSPGENTIKNNADHFVKRGDVEQLSLAQAATALLTLQLNAPSGGQGHRTSLRGGGPLTTLVLGETLWETVLLNVIPSEEFNEIVPGDAGAAPFSWMVPAVLSKKGESIAPASVNPLTAFWATPRRIRLSDPVAGVCDLEGTDGQCVTSYSTLSHGNNYGEGFRHPLTPYVQPTKSEFPLAVKGKPGGLPYVEWPSLVAPVANRRPATVVEHAITSRRVHFLRKCGKMPRLWVFGFDMDNMKARGWHETRTPLHVLGGAEDSCPRELADRYEQFGAVLGSWVDAAGLVRSMTTTQIGVVVSHPEREKLKAEFWTGVTLDFWRESEDDFFDHVAKLVGTLADERGVQRLSEAWLERLRAASLSVFERYVPAEAGATERTPERCARAERALRQFLYGKKLRQTLGLPSKKERSQLDAERSTRHG